LTGDLWTTAWSAQVLEHLNWPWFPVSSCWQRFTCLIEQRFRRDSIHGKMQVKVLEN
jgi:hypothetical protein